MPNPVLVDVLRGGMRESFHRGAIAIARGDGTLAFSLGDIERDIFPRSAIKLLQALPLVESGAADAFGLGDEALALACASHSGEPAHAETARAALRAAGLGPDALECGTHAPGNRGASHALVRTGQPPSALHNNCSGKHAGMLVTARHLGEPTAGYVKATHPVQQRIRGVLEEVCDVDLSSAPCGIDGCSAPNWALPLANLASGFARIATGEGLTAERRRASERLLAACAAHPFLVAGSGRFCTRAIGAAGGPAYIKTGAEAVFCAALPDAGLGVALKIDDGTTRASECAMAAVLRQVCRADVRERMPSPEKTLSNWRGLEVGRISPAELCSALSKFG